MSIKAAEFEAQVGTEILQDSTQFARRQTSRAECLVEAQSIDTVGPDPQLGQDCRHMASLGPMGIGIRQL